MVRAILALVYYGFLPISNIHFWCYIAFQAAIKDHAPGKK